MNNEISKEEFLEWLDKAVPQTKHKKRITCETKEKIFRNVDTNHDGVISKAEFTLYLKRIS